MSDDEYTMPDTLEFTDGGIDSMMRARQTRTKERDRLEKEIETLSTGIKTALIVRGAKKFEGAEYVASQVDVDYVKLSEQELMAHGVQPDVIAASKVTTVVTQLRVTARKGHPV